MFSFKIVKTAKVAEAVNRGSGELVGGLGGGGVQYVIEVCVPECHFPGTVNSRKMLGKVASRTFGNILFPVPSQSAIWDWLLWPILIQIYL